ncbi:zinc ribbon domain-containing protein [Natrinema ejinorense]|nr:zinc ribbon domain-containing protein [Natrinema ejinorense]
MSETDEVIDELTRPIVKLLVALVGLFVLRFIAVNLPGVETQIPGLTRVTFGALAGAIISLVMVGIIVSFAREIEPRLNRVLSGPDHIVMDISEAVKYALFLAGILIAYNGLEGVIVPFLIPDPGPWVYDVVFLAMALAPTILIAQRIYRNIEEITDIITRQVKSATTIDVTCPSCSESVRANLEFCPECGDELPDRGSNVDAAATATCPDCGSDVRSGVSFCGSCGSNVTTGD